RAHRLSTRLVTRRTARLGLVVQLATARGRLSAIDARRGRFTAPTPTAQRHTGAASRLHPAAAPGAVDVTRRVSLGVAGVGDALPAAERRAGPRELRRRPAVIARRAEGALVPRRFDGSSSVAAEFIARPRPHRV